MYFFFKKKTKHTLINIGSGEERKIIDYAKFISKMLDYKVSFIFDKSKPDGTPRKLIDSSLANKYGWKSKVSLEAGFNLTLRDFVKKDSK